jgi:hypothetical protein
MLDCVMKECDDTTREGIDAMIRQRPDGFLQNHIFTRIFPGVNTYINGVAVSDNFEAIRESEASITAHLCVTDMGVDSINKEASQKEIATFNSKSQHPKEYVIPPNEVLCKRFECTHTAREVCQYYQEMKMTGKPKSLVVIEQEFLRLLSEEFRKTHLACCFSNQLFMKKTNGATIYVLVIVCGPINVLLHCANARRQTGRLLKGVDKESECPPTIVNQSLLNPSALATG